MRGRSWVAALGVGAFGVVCCAALPILIGVLSGLTLAGLLGVSAGLLAAASAIVLAVPLFRRQRRAAKSIRGRRT